MARDTCAYDVNEIFCRNIVEISNLNSSASGLASTISEVFDC
jgi:hypothetical protein